MREGDQWGQARTNARTRWRRIQVASAAVIMLTLPFLLDAGSRSYLNMGGTMPGGQFPIWLPLSFWIAEVTVAIGGFALIFRGSDEYQRRALMEGAALAGGVLLLLLPPFFFLGGLFGSHHTDAVFGLWAAAFAFGAITYRARLRRP